MDRDAFDRLARLASQRSTRRAAIAGLAAGLVGMSAGQRATAVSTQHQCKDIGMGCAGNSDCCNGMRCQKKPGRIGTCRWRTERDCGRPKDRKCQNREVCWYGKCTPRCRSDHHCSPSRQYCDTVHRICVNQ
jgi:hypothetical protein